MKLYDQIIMYIGGIGTGAYSAFTTNWDDFWMWCLRILITAFIGAIGSFFGTKLVKSIYKGVIHWWNKAWGIKQTK